MSDTYRALTKIAWGYVFLHLDFHLGPLNILPNWVAYLLFFAAIGSLGKELRDLALLKPFCVLLGAAELADWLAVLFTGQTLVARFFLLHVLIFCIGIYFSFQLLTDLAMLVERAGESGHSLRLWRNVEAVTSTLAALPVPWSDLGIPGLAVVTVVLVLMVIVTLCILVQLFQLRKLFP